MGHKRATSVSIWLLLLVSASRAFAEGPAEVPASSHEGVAAESAAAGSMLPTVIAPRVDSQRGYMRALGGYDSARNSAQFEALADVTIVGPVAASVGTLYGQETNRFRPSLGLRVQALSQEDVGIDLGFGGYYRPEGFTEAEGEIEFVVAAARTLGRVTMFANLVYGQDPEAAERDGEVRLAALYALSTAAQLGLDARLRLDLGSQPGKRREDGGAKYDLVAGPTASYALGPAAVIAQAGMSVFGIRSARVGAIALVGLAGVL